MKLEQTRSAPRALPPQLPEVRAGRVAARNALGLLLALLAVALLACGGGGAAAFDLAELGEVAQALSNGTPYSGHPAVGRLVILTRDGKREQCTGSVVGAHTVLTAAHCVADAAQLAFELTLPAASTTTVSSGGAANPVRRFAVDNVMVHPDYEASDYRTIDLAMLWLPQAPGVTPLMVGARAPTVGQTITLVGYGQTGTTMDDGGIKRITTNAIAAVQPTVISIVGTAAGRGNLSLGDSGGPVLATVQGQEVVIGVNAQLVNAGDGDPRTDDGRAMRVDSQLRWIGAVAAGDLALQANGVTGDALPPEVTILTPAPGVAVGSSVIVRARVRDNVAVREAVLLLDGQVAGRIAQAPYDFPVQLTAGAHTLVIVAEDAVGNRAQASVAVEGGIAGPQSDGAGCALAAGGTHATSRTVPLALLGLLALCCRRRRRTRPAAPAGDRRESSCLGMRRA
ncbi:MAG: trypsin-like serine protease [Proteobacteria bacterium]|nr:trypsin-like serine protease [Pseudomonadota bacterium]